MMDSHHRVRVIGQLIVNIMTSKYLKKYSDDIFKSKLMQTYKKICINIGHK